MRRYAFSPIAALFAVAGAMALLASSAMADAEWTVISGNEFVAETAQRHPKSTTVLLTISREDGAQFDDQITIDLKHTYLHSRPETGVRSHLVRRAKVMATIDIFRDGERLQRTRLRGKTRLSVFHRSLCDFLTEPLKPGDVVSVKFKFTKWPRLDIGDVVDSRVSLIPQGCQQTKECSGKPLIVRYVWSHGRNDLEIDRVAVVLRGGELDVIPDPRHWGHPSGSHICSTSPNLARCEVSCKGAVRAYYHDCASASSVGAYGDFVKEGCSTAEDWGFILDCCLESGQDP